MSAGAGLDRNHAIGGAGVFVWPPRSLPEEGIRPGDAPEAVTAGRARGSRAIAWWRSFERVWLDPVAEPFEVRAAAIGWRRDAPEAYCDRCGHDVAEHEATEFGCAACRSTRPAWERFVRLGTYDPPLSLWVQEVKFTRFHALARSLGRELGRAVAEAGLRGEDRPVVVPVPTTARRRVLRGIDHAGEIAIGLGREVGVPVRCVLRRAHRPSQRAVAMSERGANVRGAFRLARGMGGRGRRGLEGRLVVLVDDVSTTGATVRACCRVLRGAGVAGVWVASVSVTRETGRAAAHAGSGWAMEAEGA